MPDFAADPRECLQDPTFGPQEVYMSTSLRPVKELWNEHTSCFIAHNEVITLFNDLASRAGTLCSETDYGNVTAIWIQDGKKLLDLIRSAPDFTAESLAKSLKDSGVEVDIDDLASLISNMRVLADSWYSSIDNWGELTFYVDNAW
jgi:hypothetical protein